MSSLSRIRVLPDQVINQIAAGEVIERPAAAVKELLENSLDAGATQVEVEFSGGGKTYIRIEDNGLGMTPEEAMLALERHATSKLRRADDLLTLRTLGFRGEALPSVASISRFTLRTRTRDADHGTELLVDAGRLVHSRQCALAYGTRIEVAHLFAPVPARRKFLKSDATEGAHITQLVRLHALARPDVGFHLIENGRTVFRSAPCPTMRDRVTEIWGAQLANELIELPDNPPSGPYGLRLRGLVGRPGHGRATRRDMIWLLNGRPIENRMLDSAVIEASQGFVSRGRYPLAFLFLEIDPAAVDVNIHPSKKQVRFGSEAVVKHYVWKAVADLLQHSVHSNLGGAGARDSRFFAPAETSAAGDRGGNEASVAGELHEGHKFAKIPQRHTDGFAGSGAGGGKAISAGDASNAGGTGRVDDSSNAGGTGGAGSVVSAGNVGSVRGLDTDGSGNGSGSTRPASHTSGSGGTEKTVADAVPPQIPAPALTPARGRPAVGSASVASAATDRSETVPAPSAARAKDVNEQAEALTPGQAAAASGQSKAAVSGVAGISIDGATANPSAIAKSVTDSAVLQSVTDSLVGNRATGGVGAAEAREADGVAEAGEAGAGADADQPEWKYLARLHKEYALMQTPQGLVVLRLRAAHERIWFERIRKYFQGEDRSSQQLLLPLSIEFDPLAAAAMHEHLGFFNAHGFEVEAFGRNFYRIHAHPAWLTSQRVEPFVRECVELARRGELKAKGKSVAYEGIAKLAATRAVRLGDQPSPAEIEALSATLLRCENPLVCPNGKPTLVEWSLSELGRRFGIRQ